MPHQNTTSSTATSQNAATDPVAPGDQRRDGDNAEPKSYAAQTPDQSTTAPPAAGEVADYADEGDALAASDVQQGGTHANRPDRTERQSSQGPKTLAANREGLKS